MLIQEGDHMTFGSDVNAGEAHRTPFCGGKRGVSMPVRVFGLVHARTRRVPRDTVRTIGTGRGRPTHIRGQRLAAAMTATLSRLPSSN
ncbi:MAG: hypothetical protein NW701_03255 [Nitrospira sp.]